MSNDLISRAALLEDFRNTITEQSDTFDWLNMIARQPVAYDVEKVVEQLEEHKTRIIKRKERNILNVVGKTNAKVAVEEDIKIVKTGFSGGKHERNIISWKTDG